MLTNMSIVFSKAYLAEIDRVWLNLFMKQPLPSVRRQSDSYYQFKREDWVYEDA